MQNQFSLSAKFLTTPEKIYRAWLDSAQHAAMTGAPAEVSDAVNGSFSAWDGYIFGKNLELTPCSRIVQAWRTTEFAEDEADSLVEITLEDKGDHTLVLLTHTQLPAHGSQYEQGWRDFYFAPLQDYFAG
jgi:uncharacterized protein YndB with AHSA1/START domain